MPQGPLGVRDLYAATTAVYNITGVTALRTAGGARVTAISVISAGTAGFLYDASATGSPGTVGRAIAAIPATVGYYNVDWPLFTGLVVAPGASQVLAVTLS
jgi:hypothetical protein